MSDHLEDVKRYASHDVNVAALDGLARTYRLVLSRQDSRYVACSDPEERARIRESFLKKKLGLDGDGLDQAIVEVCQAMKDDRLKSRLTFYYLLAERFDRLSMFA